MVPRRRAVLQEDAGMAETIVPHFHNDPGVSAIEIGAKEFMCIGATPPFDQGDDTEAVCPYCSSLYRFDPSLHGYESRPGECAWREPARREAMQAAGDAFASGLADDRDPG